MHTLRLDISMSRSTAAHGTGRYWRCPTRGRDIKRKRKACPGCGFEQVYVPEPLAAPAERCWDHWILALLGAGALTGLWLLS
jgi:hypothetical protein